MDRFPRTFSIVREGAVCAVTVRNTEELLNLRTELELILQAGRTAKADSLHALERCLERLRRQNGVTTGPRADGIAEMCWILRDAASLVNHTTAACIDVDFLNVRRSLNMSAIQSETERFSADLSAELDSLLSSPADPSAADASDLTEVATLTSDAEAAALSASGKDTEPLSQPSYDLTSEVVDDVQQTADEIDELTRSLEEVIGLPDELTDGPVGPAVSAAPAASTPAASSQAVPASPDVASGKHLSVAGPTDFRSQICEIRNHLIHQLDRLAELFDEAVRMQAGAKQALDEVRRVEQATLAAKERSREYGAAQQQAEAARLAYERANARAAEARTAWESAQEATHTIAQRLQQNAPASR